MRHSNDITFEGLKTVTREWQNFHFAISPNQMVGMGRNSGVHEMYRCRILGLLEDSDADFMQS